MRIIRKWFPRRKNVFPLRREKRALVELDKNVEINLELKNSSNLQILNNRTKIITEQEQLIDSVNGLSNNYHDGNCICLFVMLVFYYLSIITTKFKNTLEENINNRKN